VRAWASFSSVSPTIRLARAQSHWSQPECLHLTPESGSITQTNVEPVFGTKERAIGYADTRACFRSGEIRILDSAGYIERTILQRSESEAVTPRCWNWSNRLGRNDQGKNDIASKAPMAAPQNICLDSFGIPRVQQLGVKCYCLGLAFGSFSGGPPRLYAVECRTAERVET